MTTHSFCYQRLLVIVLGALCTVQSFQSSSFSAAKNICAGNASPSSLSSSALAAEPVYLSQNHIATLRKEAAKRIANNRIPVIFLQESETNCDFQPSITEICTAFATAELVQVRGLSRESKKQIRNVADLLMAALSVEMEKDVNLVECKGHACVYYCPVADDDDAESRLELPKIKLHTSVGKKNEWTKKPRPVRDNSGQIIPGLYE